MRSTRVRLLVVLAFTLVVAVIVRGQQKKQPPDPAKALTGQVTFITKQVLEMAADFPAEKYDFKPTPEVRSFREVVVHAMSGTQYAAKAGRGEDVQWSELDANNYKDKAAVVEAFKKIAADLDASLKATPATRFAASPEPWLSVTEHTGEHYGQLVVYYRLNKMVPPASRPKKK
jgi:hypothetical protein